MGRALAAVNNLKLRLGERELNLTQPQVMGVLNVTPDSFSDGGRHFAPDDALAQAARMRRDGAAIIDIGGESTRPGAAPVSVTDELQRVLPVVIALRADVEIIISVDTSKPEVMQAVIDKGVHLINDVNALQTDGALQVCADSNVAVCLMHMRGNPRTMQDSPRYDDVVADVAAFLRQRIDACLAAGIPDDRIVIDPGFGFGKTVQHNLDLLVHLDRLCELGVPVLAGLSRKSLLGALLGRDVNERLAGSVALATLAATHGASIIRAHDVAATLDAVRVAYAVSQFIQGAA